MKTRNRILATIVLTLGTLLANGCSRASDTSDGSDSSVSAGPKATANWGTDFSAALAQAKASRKVVLLDFTGSDWCGWCQKMHEEVLDTKTFKDFADGNLVLVTLDFPHSKALPAAVEKQNNALQSKYGVEGFPTYIVLSPDGKQLDEMVGYQPGGVGPYISRLKQYVTRYGKPVDAPAPTAPVALPPAVAPTAPVVAAPAPAAIAPGSPAAPTPPAAAPVAAPMDDGAKLKFAAEKIHAIGNLGGYLAIPDVKPVGIGQTIPVIFPNDTMPTKVMLTAVSDHDYTLKLNDTSLKIEFSTDASSKPAGH